MCITEDSNDSNRNMKELCRSVEILSTDEDVSKSVRESYHSEVGLNAQTVRERPHVARVRAWPPRRQRQAGAGAAPVRFYSEPLHRCHIGQCGAGFDRFGMKRTEKNSDVKRSDKMNMLNLQRLKFNFNPALHA